MPGGPSLRRDRTVQDHSRSMSAATTAQVRVELLNGVSVSSGFRPSLPLMHGSSALSSPGPPRRTPIVYPILLSRVAKAFRACVAVNDRIKEYMDACQAVNKIAYFIQTNNSALPKFFQFFAYNNRMCIDSAPASRVPSPFVSGKVPALNSADGNVLPLHAPAPTHDSVSPSNEFSTEVDGNGNGRTQSPRAGSIPDDRTICATVCLEQQARSNMKPQLALKKQKSLGELVIAAEPGQLWTHSVPQEAVNIVSDHEKDSAPGSDIRDDLHGAVLRAGDIMLTRPPHTEPFVSYGVPQLYEKHEFEKERSSNLAFVEAKVRTMVAVPHSMVHRAQDTNAVAARCIFCTIPPSVGDIKIELWTRNCIALAVEDERPQLAPGAAASCSMQPQRSQAVSKVTITDWRAELFGDERVLGLQLLAVFTRAGGTRTADSVGVSDSPSVKGLVKLMDEADMTSEADAQHGEANMADDSEGEPDEDEDDRNSDDEDEGDRNSDDKEPQGLALDEQLLDLVGFAPL
ncbi:hypothetical protein FA95DRAFT_1576764 [Auriscalpium vulgare]|uniref:Uncharacterized protein n=1 Tax=Auriscalpium vulgare TaxID=40419 RepID=A0ACB8R9U5_9AGAM|nr:hypothetical protein FA95DRAFT_1576764 [Auriscalpium vulgare]